MMMMNLFPLIIILISSLILIEIETAQNFSFIKPRRNFNHLISITPAAAARNKGRGISSSKKAADTRAGTVKLINCLPSKPRPKRLASPPSRFTFHADFSPASFISGFLLASSIYLYAEKDNLETELLKTQLLTGEISIENAPPKSVIINDPKFLEEAFKRGNEHLCISLLKVHSNEILFDGILIGSIYKNMPKVVDHLLDRSPQINQIDQRNEETGDTPLLAAIKLKMFSQARRLLRMGAKPFIPATDKHQSRGLKEFIKEIDGNLDEEAEALRKELIKLYAQ